MRKTGRAESNRDLWESSTAEMESVERLPRGEKAQREGRGSEEGSLGQQGQRLPLVSSSGGSGAERDNLQSVRTPERTLLNLNESIPIRPSIFQI